MTLRFCLAIRVEAGSTGVGGDCFELLSRGGSAEVVAYNGSGRAPMAATPEWCARHGVTTIERHAGALPAASDILKPPSRLLPVAHRRRGRLGDTKSLALGFRPPSGRRGEGLALFDDTGEAAPYAAS